MHRNPLWIALLSLVAVSAWIYTGYAAYHLWQFWSLDATAQAEQISWKIISLDEDRWVTVAEYSFQAKGMRYQGQSQFNEAYLNEWAAQEAVNRYLEHPPAVWYELEHPATSTLQKHFPLKELTYAALLWILAIYFCWLGIYASHFPGNKTSHRRL
jgi:hypothetical protein